MSDKIKGPSNLFKHAGRKDSPIIYAIEILVEAIQKAKGEEMPPRSEKDSYLYKQRLFSELKQISEEMGKKKIIDDSERAIKEVLDKVLPILSKGVQAIDADIHPHPMGFPLDESRSSILAKFIVNRQMNHLFENNPVIVESMKKVREIFRKAMTSKAGSHSGQSPKKSNSPKVRN